MQYRVHSVIIIGLIVLSVLAPIAGLSQAAEGSPAALEAAQQSAVSDHGVVSQVAGADEPLRSGDSFWQGWQVSVDVSKISESGTTSFELWRVTDEGQLSQRVATVSPDESGHILVDTEELTGKYVLRYQEQAVYIHEGTAYLDSPPDGASVTVSSSSFRVERQTLSVAWSDPEVFPGQGTTMTITSNREEFVIAVASRNLSYDALTTMFPNSSFAPAYDSRSGTGQLLVDVTSGEPVHLNTSVLAAGTPRLTMRVADTTARASKTITMKEPAANRRFSSVERRENVGDVLETELICKSCYLIVGTPERGIIDVLRVSDTNGDGRVVIRMNTRYAGLYTGASGYPGGVPQYTSPDDSIVRYSSDTTLEQLDRELSYTVDTLGKLRGELGLASTGRHAPLDSGRLQLTVASSDYLIARSAYGDRAPFGSALVVRDETDARTVELAPRALDGVDAMAAPGDQNIQPSLTALGPSDGREEVAVGDYLVFRIAASGIFGYLEGEGTTIQTFLDNHDEGIDMELHSLLSGGEERLRIGRLDAMIIPDPPADTLWAVFRTGSNRAGVLDEGEYRLSFSLEGVSDRYESYTTADAYTGYPYVRPGNHETVSTTVILGQPTATIQEPPEGDMPRLFENGTLDLAGTTTVAKGSGLIVEARATEYAWTIQTLVSVGDDGQWNTSLDFSEAPGDEFTLVVLTDGQRLAERTLTVRPPVSDGDSDGSRADGSSGPDGGTGADGESGSGAGDGIAEGPIIPGIPNIAILGAGTLAFIVMLLVGKFLS